MKYVDPSGNIIKISGSPEQVRELFNATQALTDSKLALSAPVVDEDGNVYYVVREVSTSNSGKKPKGTTLIHELISSEYHVDISPYPEEKPLDKENAITRPHTYENAFNGKGTGSTINIGSEMGKGGGNITLVDKDGKLLENQPPSLVRTVAHEYNHALHNIYGVRNSDSDTEEALTTGNVTYKEKNINYEFAYITENSIMEEQGELKRPYY